NVNTTVVHNTYIDRTVINNTTINNNHTSFNGPGGVTAQPKPEEMAAMHEQHFQPTSQQVNHQQNASQDKTQFAKFNGGHPTAAAMDRIGGHPINEHGQVATNSKLGNPNFNANRRPINNPNPNGRQGGQQQQQQQQQQRNQQQLQQRNQQQLQQQRNQQQQRQQQQRQPQPHPQQRQPQPHPQQPKKEY
ncbi:MAG TPA: hypothetical protein VFE53_02730, partial [Mucilaginibacter sp.]|nr:hypothetical protein [Mucilaginibacter sp.]